MEPPVSSTPEGSPSDDRLESLVAECLDRSLREGSAALADLCARFPEDASRLRERIVALERCGMVPGSLLARPDRIGRYRVLRTLGQGGMGVVDLVADDATGRRFAVKYVATRGLASERARLRFRREIDAAARVRHPHVVPIVEIGEDAGVPYYAMEFVEGATLAAVLARVRAAGIPRERLAASDLACAVAAEDPGADPGAIEARLGRTWVEGICRIVLDVAAALEHAHSLGVVHRDVKPSNVMIDRAGKALLFDFGLARFSEGDASDGLTRSGDLAGTPHYASPQQISKRHGPVDHRTDVYSLGVTLYESLALRRPFEGYDLGAVLRRIERDEAPPLRAVAPHLARDLEVVCQAALEKAPERRYATASALAADLERVLRFEPVAARPIGALRRTARDLRRRPALAAALGFAAVVVIGTPIGLTLANHAIARERDRARAAAARSGEVARFLEGLFLRGESTGDPAVTRAARTLLAAGVAFSEDERSGSALTRSILLETLARVHSGLHEPADAVPLLDRALALRQVELGESHSDTAAALERLAEAHLELRDLDAAEALAHRALASHEASGPDGEPDSSAVPRALLGRIAVARGSFSDAERWLGPAIASLRDAHDEPDARGRLAAALAARGAAQLALGDAVAAARALDECLEVRRGAREPDAAALGDTLLALGQARASRGAVDEATLALDQAVEQYRAAGGDGHRGIAEALWKIDELHGIQAGHASAAASSESGGGDATGSPAALRRALLLARNLHLRGDPLAAVAAARAAIALTAAGWTKQAAEAAAIDGAVALRAGESDRARERLDAALEFDAAARTSDEAAPEWLLEAIADRARLAENEGDASAAARLLERRAELLRARLATPLASRDGLAETLRRAGSAHAANGDLALAIARYREADVIAAGGDDPRSPRSHGELLRLGREVVDGDDPRADAYDAAFQSGITALQSGRFDDAAADFEHCLELRPARSICALNASCALARKGDVDAARSWLERAVLLGLGYRHDGLALLEGDADLEPLRSGSRWSELLARVRHERAAAARYAGEYALALPASAAEGRAAPLLVVLHERGASRDDVLTGAWREAAAAIEATLLAPSGSIPTKGSPEQGTSWFDDLPAFVRRAEVYEKGVCDSLLACREKARVDPGRILIAGEGQGGLVALDLALRSPGLFRGVILRHAPVDLALARPRALRARQSGLRVALVVDPVRPLDHVPPAVTARDHAERVSAELRAWGLEVLLVEEGGGARLADCVRVLDRPRD